MKIKALILFITGLLISGCSLIQDPEEQTIINLDKLYEITLQQDLKPGNNALILQVSTAKEIQCPDSELYVEGTTSSKDLSIRINAANEIQDCAPELIRLHQHIATGINDGDYNIQFIVNSIITDSGLLNVEDELFQLELSSFDGITLNNSKLRMVPDNIIWGIIYGKNEGHTEAITEVQDQMSNLLDEITIDNGEYGYFHIDDQGIVVDHLPLHEAHGVTPFMWDAKNKLSDIMNLKESIEANYPQLGIDIFHGSQGRL